MVGNPIDRNMASIDHVQVFEHYGPMFVLFGFRFLYGEKNKSVFQLNFFISLTNLPIQAILRYSSIGGFSNSSS